MDSSSASPLRNHTRASPASSSPRSHHRSSTPSISYVFFLSAAQHTHTPQLITICVNGLQSLLYIGLYCLFLFAAEHHTKLAAFCVMVAVGVGASAAIFYLIAFRYHPPPCQACSGPPSSLTADNDVIRFIDDVSREVDRQVLVYYIVPTFVFAIIIFSQFMGYASLYYKWLSYPGLSLEEVPLPLFSSLRHLASSCFVFIVVFF